MMLGNELRLATNSPHELVMIDGSFTLPVIYLNQALNQAPNFSALQCAREFVDHVPEYLAAYKTLLAGERSDRQFAALPHYCPVKLTRVSCNCL
ncbi:MAG: hypothetical protein LGR52_07900 [Candidatus Thiosymbion ectosymbiont of Robbea hypermnestra]|nr:hypothetical protein [Candidatus Thiosymbion ectosymbiont of Robbea hypermnestra]